MPSLVLRQDPGVDPSIDARSAAFELFPAAMLVVDEGLGIVAANAVACRLLRSGVLRIDGACGPLAMQVRRACRGATGRALVVAAGDGERSLPVDVRPAGVGTALVIVVDPSEAIVPPPGTLQAFFGLTPAEARVAVLLAAGVSVAAAAGSLSVSVHTLRTHVKRILAKARCHSQVELERTLLMIGLLPRQ